jgi:hypothetical protein
VVRLTPWPHVTPQACEEEALLGHMGVVLYEYLGEEYPGGWGGALDWQGLLAGGLAPDARACQARARAARA